jgi:hypothetical protein
MRGGESIESVMKNTIQLIAGILLLAVAVVGSGDNRVNLLPRLQAGQTFTYMIRYRSDRNVKTESNVAAPMAPNSSQLDAHGVLQIDVLDSQAAGGKAAIHARAFFRNLDSSAQSKKPDGQEPDGRIPRDVSDSKIVEFTISSKGSVEKVSGLDSLSPEQQQAWREWVARFALAWTLPANGAKLGEKWKSEQPEPASAPIASLVWERESQYVQNEPCRASQLSLMGEVSSGTGVADTCAVLLTTASLKQKSSPKDATPDDFKIHDLKTSGTARGSNEIITYISLTTGLVVRATENASQLMDVTVAKSDGSNRVRYNVDANSHSEVLLVFAAPVIRP